MKVSLIINDISYDIDLHALNIWGHSAVVTIEEMKVLFNQIIANNPDFYFKPAITKKETK